MTTPRRVAVITGSRAEFGLLEPVMRAIDAHTGLELRTVVAGSHLLAPAETWRDVEAAGFTIHARIPMQQPGETGRLADAAAAGRGIERMAQAFADMKPDWVLALGDRIEAFASAAAASIGGVAFAHMHGGDRAEGIADEAMRHAATKLAHIHLAATDESAMRIVRMGESADRVHIVGSPAIDGLEQLPELSDAHARELADPQAALLLHPAGLSEQEERATARAMCAGLVAAGIKRAVAFAPNADPGRQWIDEELRGHAADRGWPFVEHLPRTLFAGLLKRLAARGGVLIGNSSAGLIEAAALRLPVVNLGPRQAGRDRAGNVIDVVGRDTDEVAAAIAAARNIDRQEISQPYGDGDAGLKSARILADVDPHRAWILRKRNSY
jgi:UDP-hydrolysing UDP-N-acetyl-D-glucosamine 2-epimerase